MKALVVALVLVVVARTASAQPGATEPIPEGAMEPPPVYAQPQQYQQPTGPQKSESTALWLSLGGTIGSYALLIIPSALASGRYSDTANQLAASSATVGLVGTLLAPTFGHWYAGRVFTRGFGLRLGAMPVMVLGLVVALSGCTLFSGGHDDSGGDDNCGQGAPIGVALMIGAGGMWVGGTVDDIIQAPRRVRRNNSTQYAITPLIQHDGAGLALVGAF